MISIVHDITKKIEKEGKFPFLFWVKLSHKGRNAIKGKISLTLGEYKYKEEFTIPGTEGIYDLRTQYIGIPCQERPEPKSTITIQLKYEGQRQEETVTVTDVFEDLSDL